MGMKVHNLKKLLVGSILLGFALSAYAVPTLQVHGVGSVAQDLTGDEDSWVMSDSQGSLELIGTFRKNIVSIEQAFLVLTTASVEDNPFGTGYTKYDDASDFEASLGSFDTADIKTNGHSPYGLDGSKIDTFAYALSQVRMDTFSKDGATKDCNADTPGTTECEDAPKSNGQIYTFNYDFTGLALDWVHFDLVALIEVEETDSYGKKSYRRRWTSNYCNDPSDPDYWGINPGSHDTTWVKAASVPETNSLFLLIAGLFGLVVFKRKA